MQNLARQKRCIAELEQLPSSALVTLPEAAQFFAYASENAFALQIFRGNLRLRKLKLGTLVRIQMGDLRGELQRLATADTDQSAS